VIIKKGFGEKRSGGEGIGWDEEMMI